MSMRIVSKKALSIVLSVAMLLSCMVFSFSASAAETLIYENDFNEGTATNWMAQYSNPGNGIVINSANAKAVYDDTAKAMKIELAKAGVISGFRMHHKAAVDTQYGVFTLTKGYYKIVLDYQLTAITDKAGAAVDLCVGVAKKDTWYWETSDKTLISNGFTQGAREGIYAVAGTMTKSDQGAGMKTATVYLDITEAMGERRMHIFTKAGDGYGDALDSTVLVDNVKIYSVTEDPVTPPSVLKYENDFNEGTATNWMAQYSNPGNGIVINSANAKAVYDDTAKAMKIELAKAGVISGFRMHHKTAAENAYGVFTLGKGYYKVVLDYQLTSITDKAGAAVDLCVGVAKKDTWYWETSDKTLISNGFTQGAREGIYAVAGTMTKADEGAAMKTATVYLEITEAMGDRRMHIFTKAGDGYGDALNSTVLVDNVKIYEVDKSKLSTVTFYYNSSEVGSTTGIAGEAFTMPTLTGVPADCEYYSDEACTQKIDLPTAFTAGTTSIYIKEKQMQPVSPIVLKYENNFDEGTSSNWMAKYSDPSSSLISNSANTKAIYDDAAKAMKLELKKAGPIAGFRMHHKDAVDDQFGVFTLGKGYYKVEFDYRLAAISDGAGAAVDICVGVAKKGTWYWDNGTDKILSRFTGNAAGIYEIGATLTKTDEGAAMRKATVYLDITSDTTDYRMHFFTKAGNGYQDALDSTVMVDNVKIYEVDKTALSTVKFLYNASEVGSTTGIAGEAFTMPTLTGVPAEYEYFSDEACTQKIDLPTTFTAGTTIIYIKAKGAAPGEFVPIVLYENNFNNATNDNWKAILGNANSSLVSNGANTAALYDDTAKAMKLELKSPSYIAGFRMQNKDDSNGADGQGSFALGEGSYKIEIDYQLLGISNKEGAAVDVCVGFAKKGYWYWDAGSDKLRSRFEAPDGGNGTYTVASTLTAANKGDAMKTATLYVSLDDAFERRMHVFIKTGNGFGDNPAATVLVDNVRITTSNYTSVTFYQGDTVVGQSKSAAPGTPFEQPTLTLPTGIPAGYRLAYYADADLSSEIALPTVYPDVSQKIYVKLVKEISDTWSFETEANNTKLSLNTRPETTIYTDNTVKHSGKQSARINSDAANGYSNLYAQMLVKNGAGEQVFLEKGSNYEIRFWVYQPAANGNYAIDYWFAVSGIDTVFDAADDANHSRKHGTVAEGSFTPTATDAWQEITIPITDCSYGGKLRVGIIGDKNAAHPFYIDDITVTQMSSEMNVWSFDYLENGTVLDVNTSDPGRAVTVDDFIKYSGYNSVRIDGNTKLSDYFPQMMIKNDAGDQIYVYEGRNYEVKFRVYKPDTQPAYGINYWLAATTEEEDKEFNRTDEGPDAYRAATYKVAGQSDVKIATGEWVEFVVPITNCAHTGKLRLGISGDFNSTHLFYVDDIIVTEFFLDPDSRLDSFERYEQEQELALNTDGTSMKVLNEDRRSGDYGVKVVTTGNDVNSAAQMLVRNFRREPIQVEKGKDYRITFWVARHGIDADYDLQYWFAAADADKAFTTSRKNVLVDTQTLEVEKSYVWYRVKATISDCPYTGTLRLGITGTSDESHTFYIDDMYAYEDTAGDPDPKAMNFEMYDVGTNLALNQYMPESDYYKWTENTITVTDSESYTGGQSVFVHCNNNMTNNRPQMLVRDGSGNVIRVKKGDDFFVSFMMYVDPAAPYFSFGYWLAAAPEEYDDTPFFGELSSNPEFSVVDYKLPGEKFEIMPPDAGVWTEIKIAVMDCPYEGSLRIGLCHGNAHPYESSFYIDDIRVYDPEYVTVKFVTNGSEDTYPDITLMSDMLIPLDNYIDPYREGYEFLGWYTSPTFEKETFFEIYSTPVTGKTGDVITLYARWREWSEKVVSNDRPKEEQKFENKTEYYTDEVWVETLQPPVENPYPTDATPLKEAEPIVVTPEEVTPDPEGGMPPWLLVVIIVAAVIVVGGGSTLAAILLKKNKKA